MARNWTREQQRRYREQRREQAARVAARLMGNGVRVPNNPADHDDVMDALKYSFSYNMHVSSPRSSIFIGGIST